jgi:hypothetical protein
MYRIEVRSTDIPARCPESWAFWIDFIFVTHGRKNRLPQERVVRFCVFDITSSRPD